VDGNLREAYASNCNWDWDSVKFKWTEAA